MSMEAKSATETMTDLGTATFHEAIDTAQDQYENVLAAIRRNPLQAAGIAAGVGFTLALLARGFGGSSPSKPVRSYGR